MLQIPPSVVADIVTRTEQTLGLAPNVAQFHAYDEHQQPLPEPLTASQYAEWLLKTNEQRQQPDLETLAERYRGAFTSQRSAIGITPGQLAHLAIAADVLEWLVKQKKLIPLQEPRVAAMPTPSAESSAQPQATEVSTPEIEPVVAATPEVEPAIVVEKPVATKKTEPEAAEQADDLQLLRKQLLSELGLPDTASATALTSAALQEVIDKSLKAKLVELNELVTNGAITESDRDSKLAQQRRELERRMIELQSIEARMHLQKGATVKPVLPVVKEEKPIEVKNTPKAATEKPAVKESSLSVKTESKKEDTEPAQRPAGSMLTHHSDALKTLRAQEREVLAEMNAMERILDDAGLPPQELRHIRHQLNAMEELMADIQEETDK